MEPPVVEPLDLVRQHTDQYANHAKASFVQIAEIWDQLELGVEKQKQELEAILSAASNTWSSAVSAARAQQLRVKEDIQAALAEMAEIRGLLGAEDPATEAELARLQGQRTAHRTLRAWQQDVLAKAAYWQKARQQRQAEHDELQARIRQLRQLCGLVLVPAGEAPDISRANMRFLELERDRLALERDRREDVVRGLLDQLAAVCGELGEDVKAAAAEAHPSLVHTWDSETAKVMRDVYKLAGSCVGSSAVDLSDVTISRLTSKLAAMRDLKAARGAHAGEVLGVLHSLWDAIEVPDSERATFVRMMSGPLRLHERSLEKCMAEVRRLEDLRAQQMVDLVNTKCAELRALCQESHVEEPAGLSEALAAINSEGRNPGAAAELLAKLLHMLAEVQVLANKRGVIIGVIREVEAAQQEEAWLTAYEADDNRYKGRDANKRLQRAIRAGKLRERLPVVLSELRGLLAEWRDCEGAAFMYDGRDYEFEVLEGLSAEVEAAAALRAAGKATRSASLRRQSSVGSAAGSGGGSPGSIRPPQPLPTPSRTVGGTGPPRSASVSSGFPGSPGGSTAGGAAGSRRAAAGGPSTPLPSGLRSLSGRSLSERHSICVVRTGERQLVGGPGALSRSGEVHLSAAAAAAAARGNSNSSSFRNAGKPAAASGGRKAAALPSCVTSNSSGSSGGFHTPPPKKAPGAAAAAAAAASRTAIKSDYSSRASAAGPVAVTALQSPLQQSAGFASAAGGKGGGSSSSCKRASTSSRLDTIFRRGSVQHPVARLDTAPAAAAAAAGETDKYVKSPVQSPIKSPAKSKSPTKIPAAAISNTWSSSPAAASSGGGADIKAAAACDQDQCFDTSTPSPISQPNFAA